MSSCTTPIEMMQAIRNGISCLTLAVLFSTAAKAGEDGTLPFPAELLPPDGWQNVQWEDPGDWRTIDVTQHGCKPDDETIDAAAKVMEILKDARGNVILYFPAGVYYLNSDLEIRRDNVRIAGAGHDKTELLINTKAEDNGEVAFIGGGMDEPVDVVGKPKRGDDVIQVSNAAGLRVGDHVELFNDSGRKAWGMPQESQILRILQVRGSSLRLDMKLGINFFSTPRIRKLNMVKNVGIEKVHVRRVRAAEAAHTANINFQLAFNGFARDCESSRLERGGVAANRSRNIVVERCLVHHAFDYGGGGQAYGILFNCGASNCRATNNKLWHLRHHIQLAIGANHCVISYNSLEPAYTCGHDCHIHGFFVHNSLFEGNTGRGIGADRRGSSSGRYNAYFRNRFERVSINTKESASHFLVAGNTSRRCRVARVSNVARIDNVTVGESIPKSTALPPSLYLKEKPEFLKDHPWPVFGPGVDKNAGWDNELPAKAWPTPESK